MYSILLVLKVIAAVVCCWLSKSSTLGRSAALGNAGSNVPLHRESPFSNKANNQMNIAIVEKDFLHFV